MYRWTILIIAYTSVAYASPEFFGIGNLGSYARIFNFTGFSVNETGNELWHGLFRDCKKKVTFSCIQKNAYTYLDGALVERDNITVFDGLVLTKNSLDYGSCPKKMSKRDELDDNLVEDSRKINCEDDTDEEEPEEVKDSGRTLENDRKSPLEEITNALRKRTVKFLATRNYELQLPEFFFDGATVRISPREIDDSGALLRVDFGQRSLDNEGRLFKKIRRFIQNKLLMSFLALLLIIKLIKVKFMFVIPFLFGVGTAKKLFLKLLLFLVPAFAHIFKLCSSYYSHGTKYHHHHHQIAHHHHHVPVPVPVPTYYDHHHHHPEPEFDGYDYAHPHIQYRKDVEELREWGIEPYEDSGYNGVNEHVGAVSPGHGAGPVPGIVPAPSPLASQTYANNYGVHQYAPNARPVGPYHDKHLSASSHNLAYSGYLDESNKYNRRIAVQQPTMATAVPVAPLMAPVPAPSTLSANSLLAAVLPKTTTTNLKTPYVGLSQSQQTLKPNAYQAQKTSPVAKTISTGAKVNKKFDDDYFGPIVGRLEDIFTHLRFSEEPCRERLVCSMYKNPTLYSPHSNLVSNELSRDPNELSKREASNSVSSQKFHRYMNAARLGQDGGDCLRTYPCHINTE
ncbi:uncharacterized protein [Prorops nasuta]|uniref:uncharacterized protein n=1 Tax=Prorops nasuta TaxID=863751 RepID=UPI0034CDE26A